MRGMRPCDSNSITVGSCNWWVILTGQFLCDVADTMESLFMCCVALRCVARCWKSGFTVWQHDISFLSSLINSIHPRPSRLVIYLEGRDRPVWSHTRRLLAPVLNCQSLGSETLRALTIGLDQLWDSDELSWLKMFYMWATKRSHNGAKRSRRKTHCDFSDFLWEWPVHVASAKNSNKRPKGCRADKILHFVEVARRDELLIVTLKAYSLFENVSTGCLK